MKKKRFLHLDLVQAQGLIECLTVENDNTGEGEVEEEGRPVAGIHHGEDDGGHEDQHLDQQRPYDPAR